MAEVKVSEKGAGRIYFQVYYLPEGADSAKAPRINVTSEVPDVVGRKKPRDPEKHAELLLAEAVAISKAFMESDFVAVLPQSAVGGESPGILPGHATVDVTHLIRSQKNDGTEIVDFFDPSRNQYKMARLWIGNNQPERMTLVEIMTGKTYADLPIASVTVRGNSIELISGQHTALVKLKQPYTVVKSPRIDKETGQQQLFQGKPSWNFYSIVGIDLAVLAEQEAGNTVVEEKVVQTSNPFPEFDSIYVVGLGSKDISAKVAEALQERYKMLDSELVETIDTPFVIEVMQAFEFSGWAGSLKQRATQAHLIDLTFASINELPGASSAEEIELQADKLREEIAKTNVKANK